MSNSNTLHLKFEGAYLAWSPKCDLQNYVIYVWYVYLTRLDFVVNGGSVNIIGGPIILKFLFV